MVVVPKYMAGQLNATSALHSADNTFESMDFGYRASDQQPWLLVVYIYRLDMRAGPPTMSAPPISLADLRLSSFPTSHPPRVYHHTLDSLVSAPHPRCLD